MSSPPDRTEIKDNPLKREREDSPQSEVRAAARQRLSPTPTASQLAQPPESTSLNQNVEDESENDRSSDADASDSSSTSEAAPIPIEFETSATEPNLAVTINGSYATPDYWGFTVYRTAYGDEADWQATKAKIRRITEGRRDSIVSEGGNLDNMMLRYISNESKLKDLTSQQVRLVHHPEYNPDEEAHSDPPSQRADGTCAHVCLMIDRGSMDSILGRGPRIPYVIAIDANTEESESGAPWDGTIMVEADCIFDELYLRTVGDNVLVLGEIHGDADDIWAG